MDDYEAAVAHLRKMADPVALERSGIDHMDSLGADGSYAAWGDKGWAHWRDNAITAVDRVLVAAVAQQIASRSGSEAPAPYHPAADGGAGAPSGEVDR